LWNDTGHVRDTFDWCNSISSMVELNNNTLKACCIKRVTIFTLFFLSLIGDGYIEKYVESMVLVDHVKIPFWNFEQIFCHFFPEEGEKKRKTFSTAREINIFFVFAM